MLFRSNTGWRHAGRRIVPLKDIALRVKLAAGERVREARLASNESTIAYAQDGEWVNVNVPTLDDHEIVIFELA